MKTRVSLKYFMSFCRHIESHLDYTELNGGVIFFCFRLEKPFLDKFDPKNQNCQFKFKFGSWTNSNMQNSMVVFTFSVLPRKYSFWVKFI